MLRRLTAAGARAVVFDIVFSDPGPDSSVDQEFAETIRANGRVILGADLSEWGRKTETTVGIRSLTLSLPDRPLREAAAGWGVARFGTDDDFVARRYFPGFPGSGRPSLTWATATLLDLPVTRDPDFLNVTRWVNYYGPPLAIPHVSFSTALDPNSVDDKFFRNRVVLVGARPMTGGFQERRDEFRSPYYTWGEKDLFHPGVEVHATQMLNLVRHDWLRRWPLTVELVILTCSALFLGLGFPRVRPLTAAGIVLGAEMLIVGTVIYAFAVHRLWFPWMIASAVQIPGAFAVSVVYHSIDWFRQRRRLEAIRRQAEQKIREQAALLDKARDAILVADLDGKLSYTNPSALEFYGGSLEQLGDGGLGCTCLADSIDTVTAARKHVLEKGEWSGELRQRTLAGEPLIVESRWTLIRDGDGRPQSILMINTDITEKKRIEAQFLRTQRMETIGTLAGGMAHDLNNALSPILMGVQLLQRRPQDDDTRRMLDVMESNTHRGADLVRQVLLFSRGRAGDREILRPGQFIHEIDRLLRKTFPRSIDVQTLVPDDLWPVQGNPTQMHQVLLNLCVNARDAMPQGGTLTLAADNVNLSTAEAAAIPGAVGGPFVMIMVSDSGAGIPSDVRERIFEPFFTTKPEGQGTGLGLSTVASIVKNHGGFIRVESEPGVGTSFEIYLPRAEVVSTLIPEEPLPEVPRGNQELLLIVDDELSIREMLQLALIDHGYRVLLAANGVEAVPLVQQHAAQIRLAIMDCMMPLLDGKKTLTEIRRLRRDLPVILVSGQKDTGIEAVVTGNGPVITLSKPFRLEQLFQLIHEQLNRV